MNQDNINAYLDSLSISNLEKLRYDIDTRINKMKKIEEQHIQKANIEIKEIWKINDIGIVLRIDLISPGIIKPGFTYKLSNNTNNDIKSNSHINVPNETNDRKLIIKNFEYVFPKSHCEYPMYNIPVSISFTNKKMKIDDLYIGMILEPE